MSNFKFDEKIEFIMSFFYILLSFVLEKKNSDFEFSLNFRAVCLKSEEDKKHMKEYLST